MRSDAACTSPGPLSRFLTAGLMQVLWSFFVFVVADELKPLQHRRPAD